MPIFFVLGNCRGARSGAGRGVGGEVEGGVTLFLEDLAVVGDVEVREVVGGYVVGGFGQRFLTGFEEVRMGGGEGGNKW